MRINRGGAGVEGYTVRVEPVTGDSTSQSKHATDSNGDISLTLVVDAQYRFTFEDGKYSDLTITSGVGSLDLATLIPAAS